MAGDLKQCEMEGGKECEVEEECIGEKGRELAKKQFVKRNR